MRSLQRALQREVTSRWWWAFMIRSCHGLEGSFVFWVSIVFFFFPFLCHRFVTKKSNLLGDRICIRIFHSSHRYKKSGAREAVWQWRVAELCSLSAWACRKHLPGELWHKFKIQHAWQFQFLTTTSLKGSGPGLGKRRKVNFWCKWHPAVAV